MFTFRLRSFLTHLSKIPPLFTRQNRKANKIKEITLPSLTIIDSCFIYLCIIDFFSRTNINNNNYTANNLKVEYKKIENKTVIYHSTQSIAKEWQKTNRKQTLLTILYCIVLRQCSFMSFYLFTIIFVWSYTQNSFWPGQVVGVPL